MERKDFLKRFAIGGSILLTTPLIFESCSDNLEEENNSNTNNSGSNNTVDLTAAAYAALKNVGGYAYKGDVIIIRISDTQYAALSKICTHQGCEVKFESSQVVCPCHNSKFDTAGKVLQGPATSALKTYTITKNGDIITIG